MSTSNSGSATPSYYFILRVALDHIKPPIWRRLIVPASITLDMLHDALQAAMGWQDCHLHSFSIAGRRFTEHSGDANPDAAEFGEDECGVVLGELISKPKEKFTYEYDFGDDWQHTVTMEKVEPIPPGHSIRLHCLAGKRCGPPEDSGGPWGYAERLEALDDPDHPEHKEISEWLGDFDPEEFEVDEVNKSLARLMRWSRKRKS